MNVPNYKTSLSMLLLLRPSALGMIGVCGYTWIFSLVNVIFEEKAGLSDSGENIMDSEAGEIG